MCFTCVCPHGTSGLIRSSLCLNIHSTDWWAEPSSWYKTSWHSSHELCVFWLEGRPSGLSLWFECGAVGGEKVGQVGILTQLVGVTTTGTIATGQSFSRNGNTGISCTHTHTHREWGVLIHVYMDYNQSAN